MDNNSEILKHNEINKTQEENENENKTNRYITIDDMNYSQKKVRITSPRSIKVMKRLGINNDDLEYLTFKEYLEKNPELIGEKLEMKKLRYDYIQLIRKDLIDQVREARKKMIEEGEEKTKRSVSSKYRKSMGLDNININTGKFTEKDLKAFKRMRNINKTNLFNRLEIELNKELKKLINEEQNQIDKEKKYKLEKQLERRLKLQNIKKMVEEEEKTRLEKEIDKMKRKEEVKRIEKLIEEEKIEQEMLKEYYKKELNAKLQSKRKEEQYKNNLEKLREYKHKEIAEKNNQRQIRITKNLLEIEKQKKKKRLNSELNFKKRMQIVEENKKKIEEDNELNNRLLLYKQQSQKIKLEKEEARRKKEMKIYQKKVISQISKNNTEDWLSLLKQKNLNSAQVMDLLNNMVFLNDKEKRAKETLIKNEILMNKRKENIMNNIHDKEINIKRTQSDKDYINLLEKEKKIKNLLDKENRVKLIRQYSVNKREQLMEDLQEKDKKVEKFNQNKTDLIHLKRLKYDKITKEKELDNEKFEKIMNKKSLDNKSLQSFVEMFPKNQKMYRIINEFNMHLGKKDNYRYTYNYQN